MKHLRTRAAQLGLALIGVGLGVLAYWMFGGSFPQLVPGLGAFVIGFGVVLICADVAKWRKGRQ